MTVRFTGDAPTPEDLLGATEKFYALTVMELQRTISALSAGEFNEVKAAQTAIREGLVKVAFDAGFGAVWTDIPVDLRQAVLLLAGDFYEHRHDDGVQGAGLPFGVVTLIERWRTVRILGGGKK